MPSAVRSTRFGLEVQTVQFTNPRTHHDINIIGVVHIAHSSFWTQLQEKMNEASKDGVLHLEGVKRSMGPLREKDSERVDKLMKMAGISQKLAKLTKLTFQKDALKVDGLNAKNVDAYAEDVARRIDEQTLAKMSASAEKIASSKAKEEDLATIVVWVLKNMGWIGNVQKFVKFFSPTSLSMDSAILDYRNKIAIGEALKEKEHVTLVWGAGHIPGMTRLLKRAGYIERGSSWATAVPSSYQVPAAS